MKSGLDHTFSEVIPDLFGEHLSYPLYPSTYLFFFSCFQQLDHKKEEKKIPHNIPLFNQNVCFMSQTLLHMKVSNITQ